MMIDVLVKVIPIVMIVAYISISIFAYGAIGTTVSEKCGEQANKEECLDKSIFIHFISEAAICGLVALIIMAYKDSTRHRFSLEEHGVVLALLVIAIVAVIVVAERIAYNKFKKYNEEAAMCCYGLSMLQSLLFLWIIPLFMLGGLCYLVVSMLCGDIVVETPKSSVKHNDPFEYRRDGRGNKYYNFNDNYVKDEDGELHEIIDDGAGNKYIRDDPLALHRDEKDR